jgi:hypothetical protein
MQRGLKKNTMEHRNYTALSNLQDFLDFQILLDLFYVIPYHSEGLKEKNN